MSGRRIVVVPTGTRALSSPLLPDDRVLLIDIDRLHGGDGSAESSLWEDAIDVAVLNVAARRLSDLHEGAR